MAEREYDASLDLHDSYYAAVDALRQQHLTPDFHPLAKLFPLIEGDEFTRLVADIKERGLLHPATTFEGLLLDGRNRARACVEAGVELRCEPYLGNDPAGFVISSNLHRRHLNESQRAVVAAKLATMQQGARTDLAPIDAMSQEQAGELLNVSRRAVQRAAVVRERAIPALLGAVEQGQIAVSVAAKLADLPVAEQLRAVAEPDKAKHLAKQHARASRESELGAATIAASKRLGTKVYGVIYADPPWQFEVYSRETGLNLSADNHYPTMPFDDLAELKIPVADNCVLFLWATAPMLDAALNLIYLWDFKYKSACFWDKIAFGTGFWFRNQVEVLLVATRGNIAAPSPGNQMPQLISIKRGKHSAKPDEVANMIANLYPSIPKLEMFARKPRQGWDTWGNEA